MIDNAEIWTGRVLPVRGGMADGASRVLLPSSGFCMDAVALCRCSE